jgi:hypothetical protein
MLAGWYQAIPILPRCLSLHRDRCYWHARNRAEVCLGKSGVSGGVAIKIAATKPWLNVYPRGMLPERACKPGRKERGRAIAAAL